MRIPAMLLRRSWAFWVLLTLTRAAYAEPAAVQRAAVDLPVTASVDVLVVGGSTGGVAAAAAAAAKGAKVFLVTPYPYLGDDMTATLRLWLEEGEKPTSPLAMRLFIDPHRDGPRPDPDRLPLSYQTDRPSGASIKTPRRPRC